MQRTEYIGFHNPKTSGCTTVAINAALTRKQISTGENIAFIQFAEYGDLDLHLGIKPLFNISNLTSFIGTDEWTIDLLPKISVPFFGVDFYHSPEIADWKNLSEKKIEKIFSLLNQRYEKIFIDFGSAIPPLFQKYFYSKIQKLVLVGTLAPVSFRTIDQFQQNHDFSQMKIFFCLNQCPKESIRAVKKQVKTLKADFLGILPQDIKSCWYQTYEGLPCALQKRSAFKKALIPMVEKL